MKIIDLETALKGNYTMVFDDTVVPAGTVKHVNNDTKEEVIVVMNAEVYERCNNKATNNTVSKKEDKNMKATNNTTNTTTNTKEATMEKKGLFGFFNDFTNSFKAAYASQTADLDEAREAGKEAGRKVAGVVYRPAYVAGYAAETVAGLVEDCAPLQDVIFSAKKGFEDGRAAKVNHDADKIASEVVTQ